MTTSAGPQRARFAVRPGAVAAALALTAAGLAPAGAWGASSWSPPVDVPGSAGAATPVVDGTGDGSAAALFTRPSDAEGDGPVPVLLSRRAGTGGFATVGVSGGSTVAAVDPSLSVASDGALLGAWPTRATGDARGIDVIATGVAGGEPARVGLSAAAAGSAVRDVTVAAAPGAGGFLLWTAVDDRGTAADGDDVRRAYGAALAPGRTIGPRVPLSRVEDGDAADLVAGTAGGLLLAAWVTTMSTESSSAGARTTTSTRVVRGVRGALAAPVAFALTDPVERTTIDVDDADTSTERGQLYANLDLAVAPDGAALLGLARDEADDRDDPDRPTDRTAFTVMRSRGSVAAGLAPATDVPGGAVARPDDSEPEAAAVRVGLADDGLGALAWIVNAATLALRGVGPDGAVSVAADGVPAFDVAADVAAGQPAALITGGPVAGVLGAATTQLAGGAPPPAVPQLIGRSAGALGLWQTDPDPFGVGTEILRYSDLSVVADPVPGAPAPTAPAPAPPEPAAPAPASAPAPTPSPPPAPPVDDVAPVLTGLRVAPSPLRVGSAPSAFRAVRFPSPTALITFSLSEPARVQLTLSRLKTLRGGPLRCPRPARRPGPTRVRRVGLLTRDLPSGAARIAFSGRVGSRALPRGRYVVRARAADRAANLSVISSATFSVC